MEKSIFGYAVNFLSRLPCGLKEHLFDSKQKPLIPYINFIARESPVRYLNNGKLVGVLEEFVILDSRSKGYFKSAKFTPLIQISEDSVDVLTDIKKLLKKPFTSLETLKKQGYKEVSSAS